MSAYGTGAIRSEPTVVPGLRAGRQLPIIPALLFALAGISSASADCTYDQDHQIVVLEGTARMHPGGALDKTARRVSWSLPDGGSVVFAYGGCHHLGSIVTRRDPLATPRTRQEVFAVAVALAGTYWDASDAASLVDGLARSRYVIGTAGATTVYHVGHPLYSQFLVEHEHAGRIDRVAIAWSRTY